MDDLAGLDWSAAAAAPTASNAGRPPGGPPRSFNPYSSANPGAGAFGATPSTASTRPPSTGPARPSAPTTSDPFGAFLPFSTEKHTKTLAEQQQERQQQVTRPSLSASVSVNTTSGAGRPTSMGTTAMPNAFPGVAGPSSVQTASTVMGSTGSGTASWNASRPASAGSSSASAYFGAPAPSGTGSMAARPVPNSTSTLTSSMQKSSANAFDDLLGGDLMKKTAGPPSAARPPTYGRPMDGATNSNASAAGAWDFSVLESTNSGSTRTTPGSFTSSPQFGTAALGTSSVSGDDIFGFHAPTKPQQAASSAAPSAQHTVGASKTVGEDLAFFDTLASRSDASLQGLGAPVAASSSPNPIGGSMGGLLSGDDLDMDFFSAPKPVAPAATVAASTASADRPSSPAIASPQIGAAAASATVPASVPTAARAASAGAATPQNTPDLPPRGSVSDVSASRGATTVSSRTPAGPVSFDDDEDEDERYDGGRGGYHADRTEADYYDRDRRGDSRSREAERSTSSIASGSALFGKFVGLASTLGEKAKEGVSAVRKKMDETILDERRQRVPPHLVRQFEEMGFDAEDARTALANNDNSFQQALSSLRRAFPDIAAKLDAREQRERRQAATPTPAPSVPANSAAPASAAPGAVSRAPAVSASSAPSQAPSVKLDAKVAQLVEMGFVSRMAYEALRRTDGDLERAITLLTRSSPSSESISTKPTSPTPTPAASAASAASAPQARAPDAIPSRQPARQPAPASSPSPAPTKSPAPAPVQAPPLPADLQQRIDELKAKGNEFFKNGDYDQSRALYSEALVLVPPGHPTTLVLLGNRAACNLSANTYKQCIEDCNTILSHVPDDVKALLRRAKAYEATEKLDAALADYRQALQLDATQKSATQGITRVNNSKRSLEKHLEKDDKGSPANQAPSDSINLMPTAPAAAEKPSAATVSVSTKDDITSMFDPTFQSSSSTATSSSLQETVDPEVARRVKLREAAERAEEEERAMIADDVEAKLNNWRARKENNIRALLPALDQILWPELEWTSIGMHELVTPQQVKIRYMKAINKVHPDKVANATMEQKMLAEGVFHTLNKAFDFFRQQNGLA